MSSQERRKLQESHADYELSPVRRRVPLPGPGGRRLNNQHADINSQAITVVETLTANTDTVTDECQAVVDSTFCTYPCKLDEAGAGTG